MQSGRTVQPSVAMRKYEQQGPPPLLVLEPIQSALGLRPMNSVETLEPETRPPNALCIVARSFSLRERTAFDTSISSRERIDYNVHGSFCALDNAVPDILGCLRSILRHVGCPVNRARRKSANRDGDGENDQKECFHGTKVSLPPTHVRLPIFAAIAYACRNLSMESPATLTRSRINCASYIV